MPFFLEAGRAMKHSEQRAMGLGLLPVALWTLPALAGDGAKHPFAAAVIAYAPAPGQYVNNPAFSDPGRVLGPPSGGGTTTPDHNSVVTLGGFGGFIVLGFDAPVLDEPANPFGADAIVFGNAFWVGAPSRRWAEAATIEIAPDLNGNGQPDEEEWFLIPGSHISDAPSQWTAQCWDENFGDARCPPQDPAWWPPGWVGAASTSAHALPDGIFHAPVLINPLGTGAMEEGVFGYADLSPTMVLGDFDGDNVADEPDVAAALFYAVPDDPLTVGITPGSGGGDAFDIAWAVDPRTGQPAGIDRFDFIRLTTAVNHVLPLDLGEMSAEVDAVADVAADLDCDDNGIADDQDIAAGTAADCNANGVPDGCDIAWRALPDADGDGTPDSCLALLASAPPAGAIDARQPHTPAAPDQPQGWDRLELTFSGPSQDVLAEDFFIESSSGRAPGITKLTRRGKTVTLQLNRPLPPGAWTTLRHVPSGHELRWGFLPGDVNGDRISAPLDILALIDDLNGTTRRPEHATDVNRSGLGEPQDILRLIDLLNGAGTYEAWLGRSLP
jgi:hypothetical protein